MSAADLAAVIVTIVCLVVVAVLVIAIQVLVRTLRELRATVDELRSSTLPMVDDLHATVTKANEELDRVDGVIGRAERITATVDVASRLGYKAMAPPLIKTLSFVKGAGRAGRALRSPRRRGAIEVRGRQK
jgi:predicted PurR-regulated permease PerM